MLGPGDDLQTLQAKSDHLGILRYIRSHALRQPELVVQHATALLGGITLTKTIQDKSIYVSLLEQLCLAACDIHNLDLAQLCLQKLASNIDGNPQDSDRFQRLTGRLLEAGEDYNGALVVYDEMLVKNPANIIALQRKYCVLKTQYQQGLADITMEDVIIALNEYLGQQLSDSAGWYEMSKLRLSIGDYKGAAYALEQVLLSGSGLEADIHIQLAEVYATIGGIESTLLARKHICQALELQPNNIRAQLGLVSISQQYLDEMKMGGKKLHDEQEQLIATELIKYGTTEVLKSYKGTKMFSSVKRVMDDYINNLE